MLEKHVPGMGLPSVSHRRATEDWNVQLKEGLLVKAGILSLPTAMIVLLQGIQMQIWEKTSVEIQMEIKQMGPGVTQRIQILDGSIVSQLVQVQCAVEQR